MPKPKYKAFDPHQKDSKRAAAYRELMEGGRRGTKSFNAPVRPAHQNPNKLSTSMRQFTLQIEAAKYKGNNLKQHLKQTLQQQKKQQSQSQLSTSNPTTSPSSTPLHSSASPSVTSSAPRTTATATATASATNSAHVLSRSTTTSQSSRKQSTPHLNADGKMGNLNSIDADSADSAASATASSELSRAHQMTLANTYEFQTEWQPGDSFRTYSARIAAEKRAVLDAQVLEQQQGHLRAKRKQHLKQRKEKEKKRKRGEAIEQGEGDSHAHAYTDGDGDGDEESARDGQLQTNGVKEFAPAEFVPFGCVVDRPPLLTLPKKKLKLCDPRVVHEFVPRNSNLLLNSKVPVNMSEQAKADAMKLSALNEARSLATAAYKQLKAQRALEAKQQSIEQRQLFQQEAAKFQKEGQGQGQLTKRQTLKIRHKIEAVTAAKTAAATAKQSQTKQANALSTSASNERASVSGPTPGRTGSRTIAIDDHRFDD